MLEERVPLGLLFLVRWALQLGFDVWAPGPGWVLLADGGFEVWLEGDEEGGWVEEEGFGRLEDAGRSLRAERGEEGGGDGKG